MSNCGPLGWVTDKDGGYRYQPSHPDTGRPWPAMPDLLLALWDDVAAGHPPPEACLINYYAGPARLGSHVDADEQDKVARSSRSRSGTMVYFMSAARSEAMPGPG